MGDKPKEKNTMKKISLLTVLALMPVCSAMAGSGMNNNNMKNNQMMQNQQPTYWSVMEVVSLPDKSPVTMRGKITKNMGDNIYVFEDSSGTIMLEIDEEDWNGKTVRVDDIVTVYGNVDKGSDYTEIDVTSIE
jgi:uncharacterized protein (TIGR00156 family)